MIGESQKKTNTMLEKAKGKVLVIDEAYNLDDSHYGKQVIIFKVNYFNFLSFFDTGSNLTKLVI